MCADCGWQDELEKLEAMEEDDRYLFAEDTVYGIAIWIEENEHVTDRQKTAIRNIERSVET